MTRSGITIIPIGFTFSEDEHKIIYEDMEVDMHELFVRMKLEKPEDMYIASLPKDESINFALEFQLTDETKKMIKIIWDENAD